MESVDPHSSMKPPTSLRFVRQLLISLCVAVVIFFFGYQAGTSGWLDARMSRWSDSSQIGALVGKGIQALGFEQSGSSTTRGEADMSLFWEVWGMMENRYIDKSKIDKQQMMYGAIKGMVDSIGDPYTVFLTPDENQKSREDLSGSFDGIGIQLGYKDDPLTEEVDRRLAVISPLAGMPAEAAGVKAGDLILKIGDVESLTMSLPEAVELIRGERGTAVQLTLLSEGVSEPREVSVKRDVILVPSVKYEVVSIEDKQVARLHINRFGERTMEEINEVKQQILNGYRNGQIAGIVLDLRSNPGGFFQGAIDVVSEFVGSGVVVMQEAADGSRKPYRASGSGTYKDIPLVILVNEGSASSSEITAGAIRELRGNVKVVGMKTFGKGTVQEADELRGGAGVHITTYRWLLPSGAWIDKNGIAPDVEVDWVAPELSEGETATINQDNQFIEAARVLLGK